MGKRAPSTMRKGWKVIVNSNLPSAVGDWAQVGDTGIITGRYRPNCWPWDEVYTVKLDQSNVEGAMHRNYIDRL